MRVPNLCGWLGCNKPWRAVAQLLLAQVAASRPPALGLQLPHSHSPPPIPTPYPRQRQPRGNEISASRQLTAEHPGLLQAGEAALYPC